ncbi:MAG: repeat domain protein [Verrucomicrobiales bacterium]|nr:repeat domain protein [Verrucomicrobiales bacterium]
MPIRYIGIDRNEPVGKHVGVPLFAMASYTARIFCLLSIMIHPIRGAVPAVAGGGSHSVYLQQDGVARVGGYYSGGGTFKMLKGDGETPVVVLNEVTAVSAGVNHSLFLKEDGSVWAEGYNRTGELGDGTNTARSAPVKVMDGVRAISAGGFHSFFLKSDNTLWAAGRNFDGQLADGTKTDRRTPVKVMENVAAMSGGWFLSLFLKIDGTVLAMGDNSSGQLGLGNNVDPVTVATVPITGVVGLAAGSDHSFFLKSDGTVWATGYNSSGQLGDGSRTSRRTPFHILDGIKAVSAAENHSLFLTYGGEVLAVGSNEFGKLGDGTTVPRLNPVSIMTGVQAVAAGRHHSLFLKTDGSVLASGFIDKESTPLPVPIHLVPDSGESWRQAEFDEQASDPAVSGWTADPDGDGVPNLLERAFNMPPKAPMRDLVGPDSGSGLPSVVLETSVFDGTNLVARYVRLRAAENPGFRYALEFSSAPGTAGQWNPWLGTEIVESIDGKWQRVTVRKRTDSATEDFVRVRVTVTP